jgi:hypothetical protein
MTDGGYFYNITFDSFESLRFIDEPVVASTCLGCNAYAFSLCVTSIEYSKMFRFVCDELDKLTELSVIGIKLFAMFVDAVKTTSEDPKLSEASRDHFCEMMNVVSAIPQDNHKTVQYLPSMMWTPYSISCHFFFHELSCELATYKANYKARKLRNMIKKEQQSQS